VNILWGLFNLAVAYVLLGVVGSFEPTRVSHASVAAVGFGLALLGIARSVSKLQLNSP